MDSEPPSPLPPGKSKTDLRRGHFTPGLPTVKKSPAPIRSTSTTNAEQALLFDEDLGRTK
jgi:hypothetical protein